MGTGIPNISPLPKNLKLSGKSEMGIPSVYAKVKLLPIAIVANVTMKGWILPFDMTIPLNAPIAAPINKPTIIPNRTLPSLTMEAITTALKAKVEPTDRSIPPEIITSVIPKPRIAIIETCLMTLTIL